MDLFDLMYSLFGIGIGIYGILFYTGKLSTDDEGERKRKQVMKDYGWIIKISSVLSLICGFFLLMITLILYSIDY